MAVSIITDPAFVRGTPEVLFEGQYAQGGRSRDYDVGPDGRFLMIKLASVTPDGSPAVEIRLIQNWFDELQRRVPTP